MQQDRFLVFSVIYILFVVRGISIPQFSIGASRRAKLILVGENTLKSCEVFSLHPSAPSCCISCWSYLEFSQKVNISHASRHDGEVISLPSMSNQETLGTDAVVKASV